MSQNPLDMPEWVKTMEYLFGKKVGKLLSQIIGIGAVASILSILVSSIINRYNYRTAFARIFPADFVQTKGLEPLFQ